MPGEVKDPTQGVNVKSVVDSLILEKDKFSLFTLKVLAGSKRAHSLAHNYSLRNISQQIIQNPVLYQYIIT